MKGYSLSGILYKIGIIFIIIVGMISCKSAATLSETGVKRMSASKVITAHEKSKFDFKTLQARMKVNYKGGKQDVSSSVSLRIQKDEKIWISAKVLGFTVAKALLTPTRVAYYEKLNGTHLDGNYTILNQWLGADLDFDKVQNLLIGQSVFDLDSKTHTIAIEEGAYLLKPKQAETFTYLIALLPQTFKVKQYRAYRTQQSEQLQVLYQEYQKMDTQLFPKVMKIDAKNTTGNVQIGLDFRAVERNVKVTFPFSIPEGSKEIEIRP